jgi:hypothetical protein
MIFWLRPLLIIALALFATPRVMAADGVSAVICAADGMRRVVLFDFETGAPIEQIVTFRACDHCLSPPIAPGADAVTVPTRMDAHITAARSARTSTTYLIAIAASARGPPSI